MNAQQLKNSILQMAMQGKLVPQDPNDEPASVLLERIRKEKANLIKEGKIKKEKNPSYIFRGEDNLIYEKIGKNEPVCIVDEVPFEIPESWEWVRLRTVATLEAGGTPSRSEPQFWNGDISWVKIGDINTKYVTKTEEKITSLGLEKSSAKIFAKGTLLYTIFASIGTVGILDIDAATNQAIVGITLYDNLNTEYFYHFALIIRSMVMSQAHGMAQLNINQAILKNVLVPIPPINEQQRIVECLNSLEPHLINYGEKATHLESLNSQFPESIKKSILQNAVMGKLVPQDPNDEPASVLLEKIRAEKDALIKAGKLKKDKHESIIYRRDNSFFENIDGEETCIDDEITIDIPQSWEWCRLGDICSLSNGLASRGSSEGTERIVLRLADLSSGEINLSSARKIKLTDNEYMSHKVVLGNVIFIRVNGSKDRVANAFYYSEEREISFCDHLFRGIINSQMNTEYLVLIMSSEIMRHQITPEIKTTAGQNTISQSSMNNLLVPIPPLAEQKRIVAKAKELFSYCEQLVL